jgi:hypothetical protein
MRIDDFDSQWHFVPTQPEAFPAFRRVNRVMIAILAVFLISLFIAIFARQPAPNAVTAAKFGSTLHRRRRIFLPAIVPRRATVVSRVIALERIWPRSSHPLNGLQR